MAKILEPLKDKWRSHTGGYSGQQGHETAQTRKIAIPSRVNRAAQQIWKRQFAFLPVLWNALDTDQQLAWDDFAATYPIIDKYGETSFLSGQNWFCKLNGRLLHLNVDTTEDPPPDDTPSYFPDMTFQQINPWGHLFLDTDEYPAAGESISIFRVINKPLSTQNPPHPFRFFANWPVDYEAPFVVAYYDELVVGTSCAWVMAVPYDLYGRTPGPFIHRVDPLLKQP